MDPGVFYHWARCQVSNLLEHKGSFTFHWRVFATLWSRALASTNIQVCELSSKNRLGWRESPIRDEIRVTRRLAMLWEMPIVGASCLVIATSFVFYICIFVYRFEFACPTYFVMLAVMMFLFLYAFLVWCTSNYGQLQERNITLIQHIPWHEKSKVRWNMYTARPLRILLGMMSCLEIYGWTCIVRVLKLNLHFYPRRDVLPRKSQTNVKCQRQ